MRRRQVLRAGGAALVPLFGTSVSAGSPQADDGYEPLGRVEIDSAFEAATHHDGEIAYVAADDGLVSVDISNPEDPSILAERRDIDTGGQEMALAWDLWPDGDRLVLAGPANPVRGAAQGFALFDISDPESPEQVAWHSTDFYIHNGFFDDSTVYLVGSGTRRYPVVMFDVADDEPEEVGRWSFVDAKPEWLNVPLGSRVLHDVYVQDSTAYLSYWDAGTVIADVSDPSDPTLLSQVGDFDREELTGLSRPEARQEYLTPSGNDHYAVVNDDATRLLAGKEAWAVSDPDAEDGTVGGPGGITIWDIDDPESPERLGRIEPPQSDDSTQGGYFTTAHNCDIVDDRVYASWYFGGVTAHDISDPADPERLAWWRNPEEASFWTAQSAVPGETFIASSADLSKTSFDGKPATPALYVFPDEEGVQEDPPGLIRYESEGPTPTQTPASTPTRTETGTSTEAPTVTPEPTPTDGSVATETPDSSDGDGPGFGVAGALTGFGGAMYALARRQDRED
ncbi:hypothetical protein [Halovenus salina]|uniref:LVIVD repeat-containing protein n=1 Tax=Halovenus salina TaxID=1510225 RepID=A0ABD5W0I3_9EURY|nr:hypothetical protein [Halovenus salina]